MSGFGAIVALGAAAVVPRRGPRSIETAVDADTLAAFDEAAVFAGAYGASETLPPVEAGR